MSTMLNGYLKNRFHVTIMYFPQESQQLVVYLKGLPVSLRRLGVRVEAHGLSFAMESSFAAFPAAGEVH